MFKGPSRLEPAKKFKSQHLLWLCRLPNTYSTLGQEKKSCRLIFPSHYYLQLLMTPPRGSPLKSNSMSMYFPCGSECKCCKWSSYTQKNKVPTSLYFYSKYKPALNTTQSTNHMLLWHYLLLWRKKRPPSPFPHQPLPNSSTEWLKQPISGSIPPSVWNLEVKT